MKTLARVLTATALLITILVGHGLAEESSVTFANMNTRGIINLVADGTSLGSIYASEFGLQIDGDDASGYCVDLDHEIYLGQTYQANLLALPDETEWNAIAYILNTYEAIDDTAGAVIQLALWKLVYGVDYVTTGNADVERMSNDLVAEATGKRVVGDKGEVQLTLDSWADKSGQITVRARVMQDGRPLIGQTVTLATSAGTFVFPKNGIGQTDNQGYLTASIDLDGAVPPLVIEAKTEGRPIRVIMAVNDVQTLVSFPVQVVVSVKISNVFDVTPLDTPRGIGYWKHQVRLSIGEKLKPPPQDPDLLMEALPLEAFDLNVDTLQGLYDNLWIKKASMAQRARQQCIATMLNIASGEYGYYTALDTTGDGLTDSWLFEILLSAEEAFNTGDFERAKDICESLNHLRLSEYNP